MSSVGFDRVAFVGAGTMGCYNSLLAALSGYQVVLQDLDTEVLELVPLVHEAIGAHLISIGYCTDEDLKAASAQVSVEVDLERAVAGAGLVSESVPERLALKREVFAELDAVCASDTILTSNTSALLISDIDSALHSGQGFAALHSHFGALLFDIVAGPRCDRATVERLEQYVHSLEAEPLILKKEYPGYVFNALLGAVLSAAKWQVITDGVAFEDIDRAWMATFSAPLGPFALMDLFGLDVVHDSWQEQRDDPLRQQRQLGVLTFLQSYLDAGRLGRKTGAGFYQYPDAAFMQIGFSDRFEPRFIEPLLRALFETATKIEAEGVAERADIDRAWRTALGMSQGPFEMQQLKKSEQ